MKSRRYFLIQGGLVATAMFALKPLKTIAGIGSHFTGLSGSYGKLAFLHTANLHPFNDYRLIQHIKDIKNNGANAILLNAGQDVQDETGKLTYDVSINEANELSAITGDYKIINKGKLITGIISAQPA